MSLFVIIEELFTELTCQSIIVILTFRRQPRCGGANQRCCAHLNHVDNGLHILSFHSCSDAVSLVLNKLLAIHDVETTGGLSHTAPTPSHLR